MEKIGGKCWQAGVACPARQPASELAESSCLVTAPTGLASPRSIAFGVDPHVYGKLGASIPIPGYDAPSLPLKPLRDPSLSLIALSGIDPSGPVMVEVPLVENNTTFTAAQALGGRRVGFAERFVEDDEHEQVEHTPSFLRALDILRRSGAELVPVHAHRSNHTLPGRNEIDDLVHEYRLDALVSDSRSTAFHAACLSGYPRLGEPLGEGTTLWFYGSKWAKDWLAPLVQRYRSARRIMEVQEGPPATLNYPTP